MLSNAKTVADMKQKSVRVQWRGYHTAIAPNLPPFTTEDFRQKIGQALACISLPTDEERQASKYYYEF